MYVLTFYSFKGGVGRSMSLVNIAAHLAQNQQRVLIVDFDLEAPGIRTFRALRNPHGHSPGIVDFVTAYLAKGTVPDVREYVYQPDLHFAGSGSISIMPSGNEDSFYGSRLSAIKWGDLYRDHNGYLLFEELKAQWKKHLAPDYVLIDSRTGHTDVGGICTRQLPDAVAVVFFPNDQNLSGLKNIVTAIKAESETTMKREIKLHYVMSNVPDLDDEDEIIEQHLDEFRSQLEFQDLDATLYHYPSLQLVEQSIFTLERPRSRLSREYVKLAEGIRASNIQDRVGAFSFLKTQKATLSLDTLDRIKLEHSKDGEVLFRLAQVHRGAGRNPEALALLNAAERNGYTSGELYLSRAEVLREQGGESDGVVADLLKAVHSEHLPSEQVNRAILALGVVYPEGLNGLPELKSFNALSFSDRVAIASDLAQKRSTLSIGGRALQQLLTHVKDLRQLRNIRPNLALALIALGDFKHARILLRDALKEQGDEPGMSEAFNLAMATWALERTIPQKLFEVVVQIAKAPWTDEHWSISANYNQCLAIATWAVDDLHASTEYLDRARKINLSGHFGSFSAWRYLVVSPKEFAADLDSMQSMFQGAPILPAFMTERSFDFAGSDDNASIH